MRLVRVILAVLALGPVGAPVIAQDLAELCPGAEPGSGALLGRLSDTDAEMGLPGATVVARWTSDGADRRAEAQTAIDGSFTLCGVPLGTELSLAGSVGGISGEPVAIMLTDPITRRDVAVSLTGASGSGEGRILACLGEPGSEFRRRMDAFVRCDPRWRGLEHCPRENLGRVSALAPLAAVRGGGGSRNPEATEWLDELIEKARELGGNALVNYRTNGELVAAEAALIEVDPATC